jgi:hypothetical protein
MLRAMATTPPASPASAHHLATASGVLLGALCASIAIGAAIGAAFGSWQLGALGPFGLRRDQGSLVGHRLHEAREADRACEPALTARSAALEHQPPGSQELFVASERRRGRKQVLHQLVEPLGGLDALPGVQVRERPADTVALGEP